MSLSDGRKRCRPLFRPPFRPASSMCMRYMYQRFESYNLEAYIAPAAECRVWNGRMRLTRYTDYAMRVLLYLGARPGELCSISEIARGYGISQPHPMKVVNAPGRGGCVGNGRRRLGGQA